MTKLLNYFCQILVITLLAGCGFTPYSIKSLPPELKQVYYQVDHAYRPLEVKLKKRLKSCGIILLPTPTKSSLTINASSNYNYISYTKISSAQASTYTLTYTATISITDFYQQQLLPPQVVTSSRSITLQPNEVFEFTPQVEITKQEMIEELINKIFYVLGSHYTATALKPKHHENPD